MPKASLMRPRSKSGSDVQLAGEAAVARPRRSAIHSRAAPSLAKNAVAALKARVVLLQGDGEALRLGPHPVLDRHRAPCASVALSDDSATDGAGEEVVEEDSADEDAETDADDAARWCRW